MGTVGGSMLGRYEVIRHLASGGMADLLLARARGLEGFERHVVIKRIREETEDDQAFIDMFLVEARLAGALHHHNIVQVHDIGEEDGKPYFAMEYVHGENLRRLLALVAEKGEQVPFPVVVTIVTAVARALHHAHEQRGADQQPLGIVHRDVSPANVVVGYDGNVKVLDFGIARAAMRRTETQAGMLKGKAPYMAPEQCTGAPVDRRSDVFGLGIVLYELVTARRLFKGGNDFSTMTMVVNGSFPKPSTVRKDLPPDLERIILRALSRDPGARYQTAEQMYAALEQLALTAEWRTSASALAAYMTKMFGIRTEPWLEKESVSPVIPVDFDGTRPGLATAAVETSAAAVPTAVASTNSSPIMRARSDGQSSGVPSSTNATASAPVKIPEASRLVNTGKVVTKPVPAKAPDARARPKTVQVPVASAKATESIPVSEADTAVLPTTKAKADADTDVLPTMAAATTDVNPVAKAEAPTNPEAKVDTKPVAKSELTSAAKLADKPQANSAAKPDAKAEARSDAKTAPTPLAKIEAKPDAKIEAKPDAKSDTKPDAKVAPKPEAKPDATAALKPQSTTEAKLGAKTDGQLTTKAGARTDATIGAAPRPLSKLLAKPEPKVAVRAGTEERTNLVIEHEDTHTEAMPLPPAISPHAARQLKPLPAPNLAKPFAPKPGGGDALPSTSSNPMPAYAPPTRSVDLASTTSGEHPGGAVMSTANDFEDTTELSAPPESPLAPRRTDATEIVTPLPSPLLTDAPRARRNSTVPLDTSMTLVEETDPLAAPRRPRWMIPAIGGGLVVLAIIIIAIASSGGNAELDEPTATAQVTEPAKPEPTAAPAAVPPSDEVRTEARPRTWANSQDPEPAGSAAPSAPTPSPAPPDPAPPVQADPAPPAKAPPPPAKADPAPPDPTPADPAPSVVTPDPAPLPAADTRPEPAADPVATAPTPTEPDASASDPKPAVAVAKPATKTATKPAVKPAPKPAAKPVAIARTKPPPRPVAVVKKPPPKPAAKPLPTPKWNPNSLFPNKK